jgi:ubiquinone/menaquinone biosynthesis C-methylase UbiE
MTTRPTLTSEYATATPLQVRIATHATHSEHPDDPNLAVLDALGMSGTESLADIGCGDARFLAYLTENGHRGRLVGVDNSAAMVSCANAIPGVEGVLGDATSLPFGDGEFDITAARHMLYHVSDPEAALREFGRITRPGGRVAVTVNHRRTCARTGQLVIDHARRFGLTPAEGLMNDVHSETLPEMMESVFGNITVERYDNALIFDNAEPLVKLAGAMSSFCGVAADSPHRKAILDAVAADAAEWFATHPGEVWRDPKGYIVAVATVR